MKRFLGKTARKIAPRTFENLSYLSKTRSRGPEVMDAIRAYEIEVKQLKTELDEMRRDQRRMAELYDLVFERARTERCREK